MKPLRELKAGEFGRVVEGPSSDLGAVVVAVRDLQTDSLRIMEVSPSVCLWGDYIEGHRVEPIVEAKTITMVEAAARIPEGAFVE